MFNDTSATKWVISLVAPPLDFSASLLELMMRVPFIVPACFVAAAVPTPQAVQTAALARQYPFVSLAVVALGALFAFLGWLLFGSLAQALWATFTRLLWYAPLWYAVLRLCWIVARRFARRRGWTRYTEQAAASLSGTAQRYVTQAGEALAMRTLRQWMFPAVETAHETA